MKKFLRIALVFALAGATLMYTGCTKDYSGDIDDLNTEVSSLQSSLASLQTSVQSAQRAADDAASTANSALSTAKAAATADELKAVQAALAAAATSADLTAVDAKYAAYIPAIEAAAKAADLEALEAALAEAIANTNVSIEDLKAAIATKADKADLDAAAEKILALETNYIALEARVAALEEALAKLDTIEAALANKADKADVDAALAELQAKIDELLAQPSDEFSVTALTEAGKVATYSFAKWNPGTTKEEKANFAKLVKEFPELAKIENGTAIESFGALPFIVNPSSIALDDTYTFSLVNKDGEDSGIKLGNPTLGYAVKAGNNVWNVEVQSPSFDEKGKPVYNKRVNGLSLVVENADGISAQTAFDYTVRAKDAQITAFTISKNDVKEFVFDGSNNFDAFEEDEDGKAMFSFPDAPLYDEYFIIEADAADIEEFEIEIEGSEISFNKVPVAGGNVDFTITAVGVNGTTKTESAKLSFVGTIAPNAELAAKEVTLGYDEEAEESYYVAVDYAVADFGFSALEWKKVYEALQTTEDKTPTVKSDSKDAGIVANELKFYKADGKNSATKYSDAAIMRVYVASDKALPGTYTITITDGAVFCGEGEITIKNPETSPVALIKALCKDGILQIVGAPTTDGKFITYALENALVYDTNEVTVNKTSFNDIDQTSSDKDNWVADKTNLKIPIQGGKWDDRDTDVQKLLYTTRNLSVNFGWFKNSKNEGTFSFKAQVVSPIYAEGGTGAVEVAPASKTTIYLTDNPTTAEPNAFEVSEIIKSAKYVAGDNVNKPYNVFNTWVGKTTKTYLKDYTKPYFSEDGYVLTGKNGKVKGFTRDQLFDLGIIDADTWKDYDDDDIFYLHRAGYVKVANTILRYERGWSIDEAITQWEYEENGGVTYDEATYSYVLNPNNEQEITVKLGTVGSGRGPRNLGTYTFTLYCTSEEAQAIMAYDFTWGGANTADARKAIVDAYVASLDLDNKKTYYEPLKTFFACKDIIAAYPDSEEFLASEDVPAHITVGAAKEIDNVTIGFKNPVEADKFIENVNEIKNAYLTSGSCTIKVDDDAEFKAGLTSVDLPAYIKIADKWGMTMEIPFTVTVKVASK